jgi:uncharacterized DUF497 family protein
MDRIFNHHGTTFVWHEAKAVQNERKHEVKFEEAVTVFDDPLFVICDASRNDEKRYAAIGLSSAGRLLAVAHVESNGEYIRIISARHATAAEEAIYDQ